MNTRQALQASLFQTFEDKLEAAAQFYRDGEFDDCARDLGHAHSALKTWLENKKAEDMHCTIPEASTDALVKELKRRVEAEGDETAAQALKRPLPAPKKEKARA